MPIIVIWRSRTIGPEFFFYEATCLDYFIKEVSISSARFVVSNTGIAISSILVVEEKSRQHKCGYIFTGLLLKHRAHYL